MATTALWLQMLGLWFLHLSLTSLLLTSLLLTSLLLTHLLKEARSKLSLGKIKPNGTSTTTTWML
jgi:hypothetical protein